MIEMVRDAVRIEMTAASYRPKSRAEGTDMPIRPIAPAAKAASNPSTELLDPSFEQLQDAALYELEKYHEERKQGYKEIA